MLFSMAVSMFCFLRIREYQGILGLVYQEEFFSMEQIDSFWKKAGSQKKYDRIQELVLYKNLENQEIENKNLGRSIQAHVIKAEGNMQLVFPVELLQGNFVSSFDEEGCVISKSLSEEAFGNQNGTGQELQYEGKGYRVRGILNCQENILMVSGKKGETYPGIRIRYEKTGASGAIEVMQGILPMREAIKMEGDLYAGLSGVIFSCSLILAFLASMRLLRKKSGIGKGSCFFLAVTGIVLLVYMNLSFSSDYLPSAWSDFSFWGELWREKICDIGSLLKEGIKMEDAALVKAGLLEGAGCIGVGIGIKIYG